MKKQPQRTCMGCNQKKDKKDLIRIVKNKQNEITLKADLAEMMGSEVYIYSSINDKEIIAKVRSDNHISSGDSVKLYIDIEKAHLFDPESELLIDERSVHKYQKEAHYLYLFSNLMFF